MKVLTKYLTGAALDWAVAKAEGALAPLGNLHQAGRQLFIGVGGDLGEPGDWVVYQPSVDWSQGGPIIEREGIRWNRSGDQFYAWTPDHDWFDPLHEPMLEDSPDVKWLGFAFGPTVLIATMRCHVASELGEEVDIPEELLS